MGSTACGAGFRGRLAAGEGRGTRARGKAGWRPAVARDMGGRQAMTNIGNQSSQQRFAQVRQERVDRQYRELRGLDPDTLRVCVEHAEAIGINHRALDKLTHAERLSLLADIEGSLVDMALRCRR